MGQSEKTLEEINKLTKIEKQLLEVLAQNEGTSDPAVNEAIHAIYEAKRTLYASLYRQLLEDSASAEVAKKVYEDHIKVFKIVEDSTNEAKSSYNDLQTDNNNKLRMIEINEYYGEMYLDWSQIMRGIAIVSIIICVFSLAAYTKLLPHPIYIVLVLLVFLIGGVVIGVKIIYALSVDNMNYEQYNWYAQSPGPVNTNVSSSNNPWSTSSASGGNNGKCSTLCKYLP